ncbi:MAG: efflux RND transporter periplasmic adaptor subunit [Desulfotignum sp.]
MKNKKWIIITLLICFVIVCTIFIFRFFSKETIGPGVHGPDEPHVAAAGKTARAELTTVTKVYKAVGTVQPASQAHIAARVSGQVNEVLVNAGDAVTKDQLLVRLDGRQIQARLSQARQSLKTAVSQKEQARQSVHAAEAVFAQASSAYTRTKGFFEADAATEQDLEQVRSNYQQAKAGLKRAQDGVAGALAGVRMAEEMVSEAQIAMGYTGITAPSDGSILQRLIDPGDLAMPGKPLLLIRTAGGLRLEAHVRESLINAVHPGSIFPVELVTLQQTVDAEVNEVIPYADPQTRTFLVKAVLPDLPGLYPGMYGKLHIPLQDLDLILIPHQTIARVGQLEMVSVKTADGWQRRYIKTGNRYEGKMEVLSGLFGGEILKVEGSGNDQ